MKKHVLEILEEYKKQFPQDKDINKFFEYLDKNENCIDRKNMNGHITVSGCVLKDDNILMLYHKAGSRYQQPGGHIDDTDKNIFEAARREVLEETGVETEKLDGIFNKIPVSLDVHKINTRKEKNEGEHFHFDIMILLKPKNGEQNIFEQFEEVADVKWVDKKDNDFFQNINTIKKALEKI